LKGTLYFLYIFEVMMLMHPPLPGIKHMRTT